MLELQALPRNLYGFLTFGTAKGASFTFLAQITNIVGTCMRGTIQERYTYLIDILQVKNFAGTGIGIQDLWTLRHFIMATPS